MGSSFFSLVLGLQMSGVLAVSSRSSNKFHPFGNFQRTQSWSLSPVVEGAKTFLIKMIKNLCYSLQIIDKKYVSRLNFLLHFSATTNFSVCQIELLSSSSSLKVFFSLHTAVSSFFWERFKKDATARRNFFGDWLFVMIVMNPFGCEFICCWLVLSLSGCWWMRTRMRTKKLDDSR